MPPTRFLQERDDDDGPESDVVPLILAIILFIFLAIPATILLVKRWKHRKAISQSNGNDVRMEANQIDDIQTSGAYRRPLMQEPMDTILETEEIHSSPTEYRPEDNPITNDILGDNPTGYFDVASSENGRYSTMMSVAPSSTCLPGLLGKKSSQDLLQQAATTTSQDPSIPPLPILGHTHRHSQPLENSLGRTMLTKSPRGSPSTSGPVSPVISPPEHFLIPLRRLNLHGGAGDNEIETQDKVIGALLKGRAERNPRPPSPSTVVSHIERRGSIESVHLLAAEESYSFAKRYRSRKAEEYIRIADDDEV